MKKTLTAFEERTLAAIAARIFPATNTPGAVEAGAVEYIVIALGEAYAPQLPFYRSGLRAINRHARQKCSGGFASLNDYQKDDILADFESGNVPQWKKAAAFFKTLRDHVLEGVFCEPQYGGNKNMMGWRLVGFPGQQFGYTDAYIDKPVDLEPMAAGSMAEDEN
ncbi:MAG: gluconate 2-dehydrogenase subunit 3 family protein [Deltaproteobacteria bacterium]|nr:gluconate 2-dehydrogenase subunit 3 family protein [Deltaproteobacteria bacterium]